MFEKRYEEFLHENQDIVREYRDRELLIEIDTSGGREETYANLRDKLKKDIKWMDIVHRGGK